ncbi:MAG: transmembrane 220 family protein [Janthinobacterium lividum]
MFLSILNGVFFVAFLGFAYVNLNDDDAWLWVSIYMAVTICCGLAVFKIYYPRIYLGLMAGYLFYAVILFFIKDGVWDWISIYKRPSIVEEMQATKPYIERTREFFGLLIITSALLIDYLAAPK